MSSTRVAEAEEEWWRAWWRADFSWDGLRSRRANGWYVRPDGRMTRDPKETPKTRAATLQDVWRSESKRLVSGPDGRQWTLAHVPLRWSDGSPAKSGWTAEQYARLETAFDDAVSRFPAQSADSAKSLRRPGERSGRSRRLSGIPLDGAIVREIPGRVLLLPLFRADHLAVVGEGAVNFGSQSVFVRRPLFKSPVLMDGQSHSGQTIDMLRPIIAQGLSVSDSRPDSIAIRHALCPTWIDFDLVEATDQIVLRGLETDGDVVFLDVSAQKIDLGDCKIRGTLKFEKVEAIVDFSNTVVSKGISVEKLRCASLSAVSLVSAADAKFEELTVLGLSDLSRSTWEKTAQFQKAKFGTARFDDAEFCGKTIFRQTVFGSKTSFAQTSFANTVDFGETRWPGPIDEQEGAFRGARFSSFVDFQGADFKGFSAFNGAEFKGEIRFDRHLVTGLSVVREVLDHARSDAQKIALEHGFRALKHAAENVRDRNLEQVFFRYELIARRSQTSTGLGERVLSWLYGLLSDYGSSCRRPVMAVIASWIIFACVYLGLAAISGEPVLQDMALTGSAVHESVFEAFSLSGRSTFNLFGVWGARPSELGSAGAGEAGLQHVLLFSEGVISLAAKCISSLQSLFAGTMLFLAALAARRRFQIS